MQDSPSSTSDASAVLLPLLLASLAINVLGFNHFSSGLAVRAETINKQQRELDKVKDSLTECQSEFRGYRDGRR